MAEPDDLLARFEQLQIPAPEFHHHDHVQVAFEMLDKYDYVDACARYASTIRAMVEGVGAPEKFNATITLAFMSLIAERRSEYAGNEFDGFLAANPDLLDKNLLSSWYSQARLNSAIARKQFLFPDRVA